MPPKRSPTHFLCIPVAGPQLARSLATFRADVTNPNGFAVPQDAVRPLGTLHLTLGVMALKSGGAGKEESDESDGVTSVTRAVEVLRRLKPAEVMAELRAQQTRQPASGDGEGKDASAGAGEKGSSLREDGRMSITFQGLRSIQPPAKATVLYAPPLDPDGVLFRFCTEMRRPFLEAGILLFEDRPLLLHSTIVNTVYVKSQGQQRNTDGDRRRGKGGRGAKERITVDAREMLERYDGYTWLEDMPLDRIEICKMGAKKITTVGEDGREVEDEKYEAVAEIAF